MLHSYPGCLIFLCPVIFLAAFIDSIAGGGGLITLPAYVLTGLPLTTAYGTNKFVSCTGTLFGAANYIRKGCVTWLVAVPALIGSLIGSWCGAQMALHLSQDILKICLVVILPFVALFMIFNPGFGKEENEKPMHRKSLTILFGFLIGLVIGCYDGFFGPGTGMFLTMAFVLIERLDLIHATGTTKIANLASNFAALIAYLIAGVVDFKIALPCMVCSVAGNILGSQIAIKKGAKFIKIVMICVSILMLVKIVIDFFVKK